MLDIQEGDKYERLEVRKFSHKNKWRVSCWECICECQKVVIVQGPHLKDGSTKSCGCYNNEIRSSSHTIHKLSNSKFYNTYIHMWDRCVNIHSKYYKNYGRRGIKVCDEWRDLDVFVMWCFTQEPIPPNYTLDRKDNDGPYSPTNCHFVSKAAQSRNTRANIWIKIYEENLILKDAVTKYGKVGYKTAWKRISKNNWEPTKAILTPKLK